MTNSPKHLDHIRSPLDLLPHMTTWIADNWVEILVAVGVGVVIYLVLATLRTLGVSLCKRIHSRSTSAFFAILGLAIARTGHVFMALLAARLVVSYAAPPRALLATVNFLFTISTVIQGTIWLRELILGFIDLRADLESGGSEALANARGLLRVLVNTALFVIALVVILDNLNVNVTGLIAGLGIGGIAIGLAAQGIFSDLFAALSILFDRPFKLGETIGFDQSTATVERIGLKSTRLRAVTGETKIVSNAQLLNKEITSYAGLSRRRFTFPLGLIYQTPPDLAARVPHLVREIVEAEGGMFIRAGFIGFGASTLDFEVQFDVLNDDYDVIYDIRHRIGLAILARFTDAGLSFAYPTQTTFTSDPAGRMIMPYPSNWPTPDGEPGQATS